jgi:hypothetical protein
MKRLGTHIKTLQKLLGVLMVATLIGLQGCGSDEGSFSGPLDNTLRVLDINPLPGDQGIDITTIVEVRMNMQLATSTVTNKFKVTSANTGGLIQGTVTFQENDTVIVFTPTLGQLPGNMQIKVELQQGMQSVGGQSLTNTFTSLFTTGTGNGFGNTNKPGVMPTLDSISPSGDFISYGAIGSGTPIFILRFSECVPAASLQASIIVSYQSWPDLGIFNQEGELLAGVIPNGYDDRTFYITLDPFTGPVPNPAKVKFKVNQFSDCNGELSEHNYSYTYYAY